jgi:glycosyltransferase involved in cell wall biosynthesis
MSAYTTQVDTGSVDETLLTAIIPIKASITDRENVVSWLSDDLAPKIHFVLVFDRPTNEIIEANRGLPALFPNLRLDIIEGKFFGPGPARNAGMKLVSGRYVAFWDSDDKPNLGEVVLTLSAGNGEATKLYVGAFDIQTHDGEVRRIQTSNLIQLARNPGLWRCLVPTSALKGCECPPFRLGEDQVLLAKVLLNTQEIEYVDNLFYTYFYGGSGQLTSLRNFSDLLKTEKILRELNSIRPPAEIAEFISNLSTKKLLTVVLHGNKNQKIKALCRLTYKIFSNQSSGLSSIISMARIPKRERFNV